MARKKLGLAPIEDDEIVEETPQQSILSTSTCIPTEESNSDAYLSLGKDTDYSEKDAEIELLNEQIVQLKKEKDDLSRDKQMLLEKMEILIKEKNSLESSDVRKELENQKQENKKLIESNDNYILKNSDLSFELSKMTQIAKNLQQQIDSRLHTYTQNGYTRGIGGYVPSKNGYQDWT